MRRRPPVASSFRRLHRGHAHRLALGLAAAAIAAAAGCIGTSPYSPGTALGTFAVVGHVQTNSCLVAPDPWTFSVKLADDPGIFYWEQNDVPVEGTLDAAGNVNLTSTSSEVEDPPDDAGNGGCTMQRVDTLTGTTSGSPITGLTGTLTYAFSVASGTCDDQLSANGGSYASLPCTLAYSITATRSLAPDASTSQ
jgi:hypothetical protein